MHLHQVSEGHMIFPIAAAEGMEHSASADASVAISLKRIADVLERIEARLTPAELFATARAVQAMAEADDATLNQEFPP